MKTRELGTVVTEVPGVEFIKIEPREASVHVVIKMEGDKTAISFGVKEFGEFVDAVTLANDRVRWLADRNEKGA